MSQASSGYEHRRSTLSRNRESPCVHTRKGTLLASCEEHLKKYELDSSAERHDDLTRRSVSSRWGQWFRELKHLIQVLLLRTIRELLRVLALDAR